jgi:hypothetical protein
VISPARPDNAFLVLDPCLLGLRKLPPEECVDPGAVLRADVVALAHPLRRVYFQKTSTAREVIFSG